MNTLKKPRPGKPSSVADATNATAMSRTMQLAVSGMKATPDSSLQRRGTWFSAPLDAAPRTKIEQYWAARALVAETLLSARDQHRAELAEVQRTEEQKREREIGAILHANDQRQRRLERVMVVCLVVLLGFIGWLVIKITPDRDAKGKTSHFTIPVLSPFTSVVEHETGVLGSKMVMAMLVVAIGIGVYAALRYRLSQWRVR